MSGGAKERLHYLDSVRGIAASLVVIYHFIGWRWEEHIEYNIASMFFNGADAVSFFFVLSGFVLSYKYFQRNATLSIKKYVFKRFLRLYPAFIFTVLINYWYWHHGNPDINIIKDMFWQNSHKLWEELIMIRGQHKYYIPGWTLGVEMALSLLMPVFILAGKHYFKLIIWLIPCSMFMGAGYISIFTMHFCLGMILAYYYPQIRNYGATKTKWYAWRHLIYLGIFILFSLRHIDRAWGLPEFVDKFNSFWRLGMFHYTGFASFLILLVIINKPKLHRVLHLKPLLFLGKISYSIYLMHWLVVVIVMKNWDGTMNWIHNKFLCGGFLLTITIVITLILSTLVYYLIEEPFIKLARRLVKKYNM